VESFDYAVTRAEAFTALEDFISQRLPEFGAYQDAMRAEADLLYHSRLSPYLNLGLLEPLEVAQRAAQAYQQGAAPINSVEGFIRQVVGWREFMYWQYWRQGADYQQVNHWGFTRPLPGFFWNGMTDMNCLRTIIQRVLRSGYAHHIERLMVLSNFCLLSGIRPQEVNDWFLSGFVDAYEWVMLPNVLGMGLFADGGKVATKPYIASANYIHKMSDYCGKCTFNRKQRTGEGACPFNFLYWNFLIAHESELRKNARMSTSLLGLRRLDEAQRQEVQAQARDFFKALT
jgi:deoxyribodipyrimidine photolyase-related protein